MNIIRITEIKKVMNTATAACIGEFPFCSQTMTYEGIKLDYTLTMNSEVDADLGHIIVIYNDDKISFRLDNLELFNVDWDRSLSKFSDDDADDKMYYYMKGKSLTCLSNMYKDIFLEIYKVLQEEL
jgi:hypothetical protein